MHQQAIDPNDARSMAPIITKMMSDKSETNMCGHVEIGLRLCLVHEQCNAVLRFCHQKILDVGDPPATLPSHNPIFLIHSVHQLLPNDWWIHDCPLLQISDEDKGRHGNEIVAEDIIPIKPARLRHKVSVALQETIGHLMISPKLMISAKTG